MICVSCHFDLSPECFGKPNRRQARYCRICCAARSLAARVRKHPETTHRGTAKAAAKSLRLHAERATRTKIRKQERLKQRDTVFLANRRQAKQRWIEKVRRDPGLTNRKRILGRLATKRWKRLNPDRAAALRDASNIKRRRAMAGTRIEAVNRLLVAERDGWRCGICGGSVSRANWSLDHVVPLSKGGPHTYANVTLAHRSCNSRRGAGRLPVQVPLFARPHEGSKA